MNKYLCLLLLFATGCTFNNDKVVIDVPTGPGNTVIIIPTPPSDVIVTINSNATESSVLNFGVVTTAAPVEKTIEITNTSLFLEQLEKIFN